LIRATAADLRLGSRAGDDRIPKDLIARVATVDRTRDGVARGAAVGAAALAATALAQMKSCGIGCDWDSTPAIVLMSAALGAGGGALVGLAADYDAQHSEVVYPAGSPGGPSTSTFRNRHPVSIGVSYTATQVRAGALAGRADAPAFSASVRLSRHMTARAEYVPIAARYEARPGEVPDEVLGNLVEPLLRIAGRSYGLESRRVSYMFSQLIGVRPPSWRALQIELLGGIGIQGQEERAYYDAHRPLDGGGSEQLAGKYYVLNFESPEVGFVGGVDASVALTPRLSVVPAIRYNALSGSAASVTYGVGAHWRF
jgi:hypothetical protein